VIIRINAVVYKLLSIPKMICEKDIRWKIYNGMLAFAEL